MLLEINPKTLRKHFDQELARGSVGATAKMAQCLFPMATADKNVAAAIFRMKARAGWREKHEVQVTACTDLTQMTDEQLQRMIDGYADEILAARSDHAAAPMIEGALTEVES